VLTKNRLVNFVTEFDDAIVKTALAIWFSLALVFAGLPPTSACPKPASKPCCHCGGKAACCKAKNSPLTGEAPAAPTPRSGQTDLLQVISLPVSVLTLPAPAGPCALSARSTPPDRAVPLFMRDCAFLL
jgi:hypothetical protein